ncbi:complement C1q tumor necrosis factor-related protein 6 [Amia ocellicauda]|uniref:complement C1q tumor necrosis factor-related protein 6 n=1 Tax=Amia ocellicauda TaxID=2972642 RepID=UPI00346481B7
MLTVSLPLLLLLPQLTRAPPPTESPPLPSPPTGCRRCCDPLETPESSAPRTTPYLLPEVRPYINITILKGDKGDKGDRGSAGKTGREGLPGGLGPAGAKGSKGQAGAPGDPCKVERAAFSVGRRKALHSLDYYQALVFDTVFVNLHEHFSMFRGRFHCQLPGVYLFNVNVHTWNFKETYLHVMHNERETAILYAQPSERSIMQSQSILLQLARGDEAWVRLYKRERDNAVYSDQLDVYITFNGYLVVPD